MLSILDLFIFIQWQLGTCNNFSLTHCVLWSCLLFCSLVLKLHYADEDVLDGVVCILKAVIFKSYSAGSSLADTRLMDFVLLMLVHLLDERDGTTRAVVMLIA